MAYKGIAQHFKISPAHKAFPHCQKIALKNSDIAYTKVGSSV